MDSYYEYNRLLQSITSLDTKIYIRQLPSTRAKVLMDYTVHWKNSDFNHHFKAEKKFAIRKE